VKQEVVMCGIVGYVGERAALPLILDGLRRLEYRGYDSAGVVTAVDLRLECVKTAGRVGDLERALNGTGLPGRAGLGHTRWATHGGVTSMNAHPHFSCDRRVAVVHNGIIENHAELRAELAGHSFGSATDTEVIPHVIEEALLDAGGDPLRAVRAALARLRGAYAIGVAFAGHPGLLVAARADCPLVVGLGEREQFLASDIPALLGHTRRVLPLEQGEIAALRPEGVELYGPDFAPRRREPISIDWNVETAELDGHPCFMEKEIHEQGAVLPRVAAGVLGQLEELAGFDAVDRVVLAACGSAWHAALAGKTAFEEFARLPAEAVLASEFRYGFAPLDARTLVVLVSQSGETADTLAALRRAREAGAPTLAVTNGHGSTLEREAERTIRMNAGTELGVAATKTYTAQLLSLILAALHAGRRRGTVSEDEWRAHADEAAGLGDLSSRALEASPDIREFARARAADGSWLFLGRGYNLPTALEGALKMKEISYLHAEGYAAGELKHGPLALVDARVTVAAVAVRGRTHEKLRSNLQEVRARGAGLLVVGTRGDALDDGLADVRFDVPACREAWSPILAVLPLQLLAYHTAVALGRDVDRPRNLAKSVTVE
jgi:glucosamine--fructose-6-phosphate aminotransferase (isomerizing)